MKTTPNAKYTQSLVRSAIAPQTIASETAAKATWNRNAADAGTAANHENGSAPTASRTSTEGTSPLPPTIPLPPSPNASPNPTR